jgi:O-methyltransferase
MRAILKAHGDVRRRVWAADSFQGLPRPNPERYPVDDGHSYHRRSYLAVPLDTVRQNFERYGLLDDQIRFLVGWFKDTLADAPIERLALLRLDGDMYELTIQALEALYPKVSIGGFVIVDDYGAVSACKAAVDDYRRRMGISSSLTPIDWTGVWWRRTA